LPTKSRTPFFGDQYGDPFEQEIHLTQAIHGQNVGLDFLDTDEDEGGLLEYDDPEALEYDDDDM